jgi:hypothetical protein|tara:strand:- start:449 stop:733 length:285 start_codon:yes stop_codon:yes gene_type:complete
MDDTMTKPMTKAQLDRYEIEADRSFQAARASFQADMHEMLDDELNVETNGTPAILHLMAGALAGGMTPKILLTLIAPEGDTEEDAAPKIEVIKA